MGAIVDLPVKLAVLAGEIKALYEQSNDYANKALRIAAKTGVKIAEARQLTRGMGYQDERFVDWLEEYFPNIGRTQAYNLMALAEKMPELLSDEPSPYHLLSVSQAIALLPAPDSVRQTVLAKVEAAEENSTKSPTVKEIEELKRKNKELEREKKQVELFAKSVEKDRDSILETRNKLFDEKEVLKGKAIESEAVIKKLKTEAGIQSLVDFAVENKAQEFQQKLDEKVAELEKDHERKVWDLEQKLMNAKNDLVKAKTPEQQVELQRNIDALQHTFDDLLERKNRVNADMQYSNLATHLIEQSAELLTTLLSLKGKTANTASCSELLLRAAHDLQQIADLMKVAAQFEQTDIEGVAA